MSGPIPAGSPIVTAIGGAPPAAPADRSLRGAADIGRSTILDVRVLPEVAQIALAHDLELLLRQLALGLFAFFFVDLDRAAPADGINLDALCRGDGGQHVAVLGAEQQRSRRLGDATRLDVLQVLVPGLSGLFCQPSHGVATAILAP